MSRNISEETPGKTIAAQGFGVRQLFRRPAVIPEGSGCCPLFVCQARAGPVTYGGAGFGVSNTRSFGQGPTGGDAVAWEEVWMTPNAAAGDLANAITINQYGEITINGSSRPFIVGIHGHVYYSAWNGTPGDVDNNFTHARLRTGVGRDVDQQFIRPFEAGENSFPWAEHHLHFIGPSTRSIEDGVGSGDLYPVHIIVYHGAFSQEVLSVEVEVTIFGLDTSRDEDGDPIIVYP